MARRPNVVQLSKEKDVARLISALRYPPDAAVRARAAMALGEIKDSGSVESLIRSALLDPSSEVQTSARGALDEMFGSNAQNVIKAYPIYPDEEPWIPTESTPVDPDLDDEEESETESDEQMEEEPGGDFEEEDDTARRGLQKTEDGWSVEDLGALTTILRNERDVRLRVRAARALGQLGVHDMQAVAALSQTALWGDSPSVRAAALHALVNLYGENEAQAVLDTYKELAEEDRSGADSDDLTLENRVKFADPLPPPDQSVTNYQGSKYPQTYDSSNPVVHEEGLGISGKTLWVGAVLVILIGLVIFFVFVR